MTSCQHLCHDVPASKASLMGTVVMISTWRRRAHNATSNNGVMLPISGTHCPIGPWTLGSSQYLFDQGFEQPGDSAFRKLQACPRPLKQHRPRHNNLYVYPEHHGSQTSSCLWLFRTYALVQEELTCAKVMTQEGCEKVVTPEEDLDRKQVIQGPAMVEHL